jgi:GH15 family glucan-1,4-alpha-glucosidase
MKKALFLVLLICGAAFSQNMGGDFVNYPEPSIIGDSSLFTVMFTTMRPACDTLKARMAVEDTLTHALIVSDGFTLVEKYAGDIKYFDQEKNPIDSKRVWICFTFHEDRKH